MQLFRQPIFVVFVVLVALMSSVVLAERVKRQDAPLPVTPPDLSDSLRDPCVCCDTASTPAQRCCPVDFCRQVRSMTRKQAEPPAKKAKGKGKSKGKAKGKWLNLNRLRRRMLNLI